MAASTREDASRLFAGGGAGPSDDAVEIGGGEQHIEFDVSEVPTAAPFAEAVAQSAAAAATPAAHNRRSPSWFQRTRERISTNVSRMFGTAELKAIQREAGEASGAVIDNVSVERIKTVVVPVRQVRRREEAQLIATAEAAAAASDERHDPSPPAFLREQTIQAEADGRRIARNAQWVIRDAQNARYSLQTGVELSYIWWTSMAATKYFGKVLPKLPIPPEKLVFAVFAFPAINYKLGLLIGKLITPAYLRDPTFTAKRALHELLSGVATLGIGAALEEALKQWIEDQFAKKDEESDATKTLLILGSIGLAIQFAADVVIWQALRKFPWDGDRTHGLPPEGERVAPAGMWRYWCKFQTDALQPFFRGMGALATTEFLFDLVRTLRIYKPETHEVVLFWSTPLVIMMSDLALRMTHHYAHTPAAKLAAALEQEFQMVRKPLKPLLATGAMYASASAVSALTGVFTGNLNLVNAAVSGAVYTGANVVYDAASAAAVRCAGMYGDWSRRRQNYAPVVAAQQNSGVKAAAAPASLAGSGLSESDISGDIADVLEVAKINARFGGSRA